MYLQSTQKFGNVYTKLGKTLENVYIKYTKLWKCIYKIRQNFGNVYTNSGKTLEMYVQSTQNSGNVYTNLGKTL